MKTECYNTTRLTQVNNFGGELNMRNAWQVSMEFRIQIQAYGF